MRLQNELSIYGGGLLIAAANLDDSSTLCRNIRLQ